MKESKPNQNLIVKYFPLEVENQELFVSLGDVPVSLIADKIIGKMETFKELDNYLDPKLIRKGIEGVDKYNVCYLYLGDHGRHVHLIYFKRKPYLSNVMHELQHFAFQVTKIHNLDVRESSGEEYFCMLSEYWFNKLIREFPIEELPQQESYQPSEGI